MRFFATVAAGTAVLSSVASAAPTHRLNVQANPQWSNYEVRHFAITKPADPEDEWTVSFNLYDPTPKADVAAACYGKWTATGGAPQGTYIQCQDTELAFNFKKFNDIDDFVLQAKDTYKDNSVGDPPFNFITTFAKAKVTAKNLTCVEDGEAATCTQKPFDRKIKLPIYAAIA